MLECWHVVPQARPSFSDLEQRFGHILGENKRNHFVQLNQPFAEMNSVRVANGQRDYLTVRASPKFSSRQPRRPKYVNAPKVPISAERYQNVAQRNLESGYGTTPV